VDDIAAFLDGLPQRPVTPAESVRQVRDALGGDGLPQQGAPADLLLAEATQLLFDHSLFNGHPRFMGYITSSPAPIGMLGDLLAAAANPNVGGWALGPMASEIEAQTIRWIAELIGYPTTCGGLLVSGGNMANFVGFLAARRAKAPWDVRAQGLLAGGKQLRAYCSRATHTWVQKAMDLFGLGTDALCWIETDAREVMDIAKLERQIEADRAAGLLPFLVIGAAGTVSTGAVDPLPALAELCRRYDLWFHVDGAYGAVAALLPEATADLKGLALADSVALDPHKWLYSPLEAGCTLVRDPQHLVNAYSFHPEYYHFDNVEDVAINYYEYGFQNSRGFRALKVWLALRQVGRDGYTEMVRQDIALARALYDAAAAHPELEAVGHSLSITTFRYVPADLHAGGTAVEEYLNRLNTDLLTAIQTSGKLFVSNAVLGGQFLLRACIVNFRTALGDVEAIPGIVAGLGRDLDRTLRPANLVHASSTPSSSLQESQT
jgi:glutamate/tyrosine decarboxylase-like PLP-dependent enzyme